MTTKLLDEALIGDPQQAIEFISNVLESSTEYSIIGKDRDGKILLWNEGARRIYGYEPEEVIGKANSAILHTPEDVASGVPREIMETALRDGKWEGTVNRVRKNGDRFVARVVITPRLDAEGGLLGFVLMSKDVSDEIRLAEELKAAQLLDPKLIGDPQQAIDFISNVLESSTEYSIIGKDRDGKILLWNEGARRIYGYEPEEVIGKANSAILHTPEDVDSGKPGDIMAIALREGKWEGTVARARKNGDRFTARVVLTPRRDAKGNPVGFLLISKDISDEIRLTEELKAAHFYTRSLIDANIDALMATDPLGIITDVNPQMCEVSGWKREELIGKPFKSHFTDPKAAEEAIRKVLAENKVTNCELTLRSKDGSETVVSYNATTLRNSEGQLQGVFAAARDITAQKGLEENLRQVQNYTRGLIEASVDALVTVDHDGSITDVNQQLVFMTGYSREELIGSPFSDYFTDPEAAKAGVQSTLEQGLVTNYVLILRTKAGSETVVSFNASIFRDTDGNVRGIFASARDITEQKRLEEELRQSQHYTRGLIESSVDAMVTVDPDLTITDVNEQMVKLTEIAKNGLIGSRFDGYFTEPKRAASGVRKTLADGYVTNYELTLRTPAGREVLVSFNASIFKDTGGNVKGIFAVARDVTEQRRLEEQLREQQNYSRGLIESSVDALVTVDPLGRITDVNEQMIRLTRYTRQQLVGTPFADYFTDPERAMVGVRKTFNEGVVKDYDLIVRGRTGEVTLVSFNAAVFRDTAGAVAGIFAAARDITERNRLEQQLREQQTYTRSLIESNIDALMTTDTLGIITDVNLQMCQITGRDREELVGTPFKDYFTDPKRAEDGIRLVLTEGRVTNYELTIQAKDGKETVVSYNATTFAGADGKLKGVFAAARDITDQKRLEEQIRQQNRELIETTAFMNNVLESSTEYSIIAIDLQGNILAWNEGARRNYGYTAEETVGKKNTAILHVPEDIKSGRVDELLKTAFKTGKAEGVFERVRKNGKRFTASVAVALRKNADGTSIGYVLISKDITDQKLLEEQLQRKNEELEEQNRRVQEANRLKSEFLANMSHELRTPLNGIIGFAEIMYDGKVGPVSDDHKEYLGDILTSSQHLLQLINDVLDLSKVESGKMQFRPELLNMADIVSEVTDVLRPMAATKQMDVQREIDPALSEITADAAKLKQVLYNYLSNAIKFTPDNGMVRVSVKLHGDGSFRIEVSDTGIGISPTDMHRLFVEFQQLDQSTTKKYGGTGLGLALTKRIVEAQGGTVGAHSVPGKGSVFYALLPLHPKAAGDGASGQVAGQTVG